eukprot:Em0550g2a
MKFFVILFTRSFEEIFRNLVTCTICLGIYQEPRILPCHHTYCKKCLEQLFNNTDTEYLAMDDLLDPVIRHTCPQCREGIPSEDVSTLPPSFLMNNLIELYVKLGEPEQVRMLEELERVRQLQLKRDKEIEEKMERREKRWMKANRDALKSDNPDWRAKDDDMVMDVELEGRKPYSCSHGSDSANWRAGNDEDHDMRSKPSGNSHRYGSREKSERWQEGDTMGGRYGKSSRW